jgi:hypothetical protein
MLRRSRRNYVLSRTKNTLKYAVALLVLVMTAPSSYAIPACDNFGQDWNINLGAFGGSFPGALLISGCRDCNASLSCGAALPLDGAATLTAGTGGAPFSTMWSLTAYRPGSGGCVSTHWNGTLPAGALAVAGTVSNEFGPFGAATIRLGTSCRAGSAAGRDPANAANGRWAGTAGDAAGDSFIVP